MFVTSCYQHDNPPGGYLFYTPKIHTHTHLHATIKPSEFKGRATIMTSGYSHVHDGFNYLHRNYTMRCPYISVHRKKLTHQQSMQLLLLSI
jgi:hypothetical protein